MDDKNLQNEDVTPEVAPAVESVPTSTPETAPEVISNGESNAKPPVDTTVMPKTEFTPPTPDPTIVTIEKPNDKNGLAIASMVCGIIGAVFGVLGI